MDISRRIASDSAVYPGDEPLLAKPVCAIGPDAPCNITALGNWTTHFLTHVDVPRHFISGGDTLDDIDVGRFIGPAVVVEADGPAVTAAHVPADIRSRNVLFKTRNSTLDPTVFVEDHVYLAKDAIDVLIERRPNMVGIDYLSVDRFGDEEYPAHRGLLRSGILILEGLDLRSAEPGRYELVALPLRIAEGDGSPVRAILLRR